MTTPTSPSESGSGARESISRTPLLSVRDLKVNFTVERRTLTAVDGVSFDLYPNEILGIVGESGSGKSVTSLACMRLIPSPPGDIVGGQILYRGKDLLENDWQEMWELRGNEISMIFQEPMTALNPVFTIGMQVMETVRAHHKVSRSEAFVRAVSMLTKVGIPDAERRMSAFPHEFSGGMRQRVMIAMALVCEPTVLIADEPTTALDVTTQAQILDLMLDLQQGDSESSMLLITHDLAVVAEVCDRVIVLYGGQVQEAGTVEQIFRNPQHPYTKGLLASLPSKSSKGKRLYAIPGNVPSLAEMPDGCRFSTRCAEVMDVCREQKPGLIELGDSRKARCHLHDPNVETDLATAAKEAST